MIKYPHSTYERQLGLIYLCKTVLCLQTFPVVKKQECWSWPSENDAYMVMTLAMMKWRMMIIENIDGMNVILTKMRDLCILNGFCSISCCFYGAFTLS